MTSDDRYSRGAHTVLDAQYHFVWKTKYGYPVLRGDVVLRVRSVIRDICIERKMTIIRGNIRCDHIHVLVRALAHLSIAKMAQYLKGKSSYRLQREFPELRKRYWGQRLWSRGYFWRNGRRGYRGDNQGLYRKSGGHAEGLPSLG